MRFMFLWPIFLATIFFSGLASVCTREGENAVPELRGQNASKPPGENDLTANPLRDLSNSVANLAEKAKPAIVFVSVSKVVPRDFLLDLAPTRRVQGIGSGFIINLRERYIVTNNHVVAGANEIHLRFANGAESTGKIIGRDENTDLAVIQFQSSEGTKEGLGELAFEDGSKVRLGDFALALGAPFGLEASLSSGVVSAVGRGSLGITKIGDFLQTDAAINPGNSGGPLIGADGRVIGVNTAIFSQSGAYAGVGFAIPSSLAKVVVEKLIEDGEINRGYLGVALQPLDRSMREHFDVPDGVGGVLIADVERGAPGDRAGLKSGDVILEVNDLEVDDPDDVVNTVALMEPGQLVRLRLWRGKRGIDAKVALGRWPDESREKLGH
jgi:serine protease Do